MLEFIGVLDVTTEKDKEESKRTSFSYSDCSYPDTLCVKGTLSHNTKITFSKEGARQMMAFCQRIIDKGSVAELAHKQV